MYRYCCLRQVNCIKEPQQVWLTPKILEWEPRIVVLKIPEDEEWRRPYVLWSHAENLLEQSSESPFRADSVINLKRALDQRIQSLDKIYGFRKMPVKNKPSGNLELLGHLEIARPKMIKKLIDIRNAVEHENTEPPIQDTCHDFLEFTWYFLRSTDSLVRGIISRIKLNPKDIEESRHYGIEIECSPKKDWIPKISGWIKPTMLSLAQVDDWFTIKVGEVITRKEIVMEEGKPVDPTGWDRGRGKYPEDTYIRGEIRGPAEHLLKMYQIFFSTV